MIGGAVSLGVKVMVDGDRLPFRHLYDVIGVGFEAVPADAVQLVMTIIGNGGGGSRVSGAQGFGGGSGARLTRTVDIDPADWGNIIGYEIGDPGYGRSGSIGNGMAGGTVSIGVEAGVLTNYTGNMSCYLAGGATTTAPGVGGIADGGTSNEPGAAGSMPKGGTRSGADGGAGGQVAGADGSKYGGGGAGGYKSDGLQTDGGDGGPGCVIFDWE